MHARYFILPGSAVGNGTRRGDGSTSRFESVGNFVGGTLAVIVGRVTVENVVDEFLLDGIWKNNRLIAVHGGARSGGK